MYLTTTMGSLRCRVLQGSSAAPDLTVVLCHGYGAPGEDLVPLGAAMMERRPELAERVRFVFPEAPISMADQGVPFGRAWWHIDLGRIAAARDPEAIHRLSQATPEGLPRARRLLLSLIDEMTRQMGSGPSKIVLGGFSQGAMVATDVALRLEEAPAGLVILSGTLVSEPDWRKRAPSRRGLHIFQSHGRQDPVLPFPRAVALRDLLVEAGLEVDFHPFDGGHTIPLEVLDKAADFLVRCLAPH
jgi:phospholipase/carboxylesterase